MSQYRNTMVGIKGDANAVGDNNRITVIREEHHHNHNHGRGPNDDDGSWVLGLLFVVLLAIAASCYYFSRHADEVYLALQIVGWCEALAGMTAAVTYLRGDVLDVAARAGAVAILAMGMALISWTASGNYPHEIVELAKGTDSFKTFWCGLNTYGRQTSLLHTLVGAVVLMPAALLLIGPALILAFFGLVEMEVDEAIYKVLERLTSWRLIAVAGLLVVLAGYAHSETGWQVWIENVEAPPAWPLCVR